MTDAETTLLYTLSTLAQTCAALAAFVGAVGIFRLQGLRDGRNTAELNMRQLARESGIYGPAGIAVDLTVLRDDVQRERIRTRPDNRYWEAVQGAGRALDSLVAFEGQLRTSRRALMAFEAWNLLVILAALVGFNHVTVLAACSWTLPLLWPVALVTVGLTCCCVSVWTRG